MVKSPGKKMSKLFFYYGVVKCRRNLNFEKIDTASYTGKNDGVMRNIWCYCTFVTPLLLPPSTFFIDDSGAEVYAD